MRKKLFLTPVLLITVALIYLIGLEQVERIGRVSQVKLSPSVFAEMPSEALTTSVYIDICSQHPQVCPLDEASWKGETNGWQTTGKRWQRDTASSAGIEVMWEWSQPYAGDNSAYTDHRENPYADFTNLPDDYPIITGTPDTVYDWERWSAEGENYKVRQFGASTEETAPFVGDSNCQSGVFFSGD